MYFMCIYLDIKDEKPNDGNRVLLSFVFSDHLIVNEGTAGITQVIGVEY